MSTVKSRAARKAGKKAAKVTAKHVVHGSVSKSRRSPFHTASVLAAGIAIGASATWLAGRSRRAPAPPAAPTAP